MMSLSTPFLTGKEDGLRGVSENKFDPETPAHEQYELGQQRAKQVIQAEGSVKTINLQVAITVRDAQPEQAVAGLLRVLASRVDALEVAYDGWQTLFDDQGNDVGRFQLKAV